MTVSSTGQNPNSQPTRWLLIAAALVGTLATLWAIRSILLLTLAAVILVVFFTMPVRFLSRYGVRRTPSILTTIVLSIVLLLVLARVMLPTLIEQFNTLATRTIPEGVVQLVNQINTADLFAPGVFPFAQLDRLADAQGLEHLRLVSHNLAFADDFIYETVRPLVETIRVDTQFLNDLARQIASAVGQISISVLPFVGDVASTVLSLLIVVFLSLYFLADPQGYTNGAIRLFPIWYRERARLILTRIYDALRGWLEGTFLSMIFVAVGTWIGLSMLQLEQAVALGVLAGLLSFVPNFGQLVAVLAAVVVGIVQAPGSIGLIILVIYGMSAIQSQIFTPLLFSESLRLPPVLVLLGQIVCGALFGFLGILLAVPLTAIIMILIQEIYVKDVLGDVLEEPAPSKARHWRLFSKRQPATQSEMMAESA
jgi:predicted PurR-regulated permease PerM